MLQLKLNVVLFIAIYISALLSTQFNDKVLILYLQVRLEYTSATRCITHDITTIAK